MFAHVLDTLEVIAPMAPEPELRSVLVAMHARYRDEAPVIEGLIAQVQAALDKKLTKRQRASADRHALRDDERASHRRVLQERTKPAEVRTIAILALRGLINNLRLLDPICPPELQPALAARKASIEEDIQRIKQLSR